MLPAHRMSRQHPASLTTSNPSVRMSFVSTAIANVE